jgi:hypothetical protein
MEGPQPRSSILYVMSMATQRTLEISAKHTFLYRLGLKQQNFPPKTCFFLAIISFLIFCEPLGKRNNLQCWVPLYFHENLIRGALSFPIYRTQIISCMAFFTVYRAIVKHWLKLFLKGTLSQKSVSEKHIILAATIFKYFPINHFKATIF